MLYVNQWKNFASVIEWFRNIEDKKNCTFTKFDIREFYPSITGTILDKAFLLVKQHRDISNDNTRLIKHCRKFLLFSNSEAWRKKQTESCFDVTMESFDGAEVCELVGVYILCFLAKVTNKKDCGLYRDDGLLILRNLNGQQINRMRKNVLKIFKDINFTIDVETNLKIVDFLDITFNLNNDIYRPYKKPNDLLYINKSLNHPPQIINQLPKIIDERLSRNSSNEEVFNSSKCQYEKALRESEYTDFKLEFNKTSNNHTNRNRPCNFSAEQSP